MAAVEAACDDRGWGSEPVITGDSGQQVGLQCPPLSARPPTAHRPLAGAVGGQLGCPLACALDWLVRGDCDAHVAGVEARRAARPRGRGLLPWDVLALRARFWEGGRDLRGEERARVAQPGHANPGRADARRGGGARAMRSLRT
eukprot:scaffold14711_cov55-Phaeocystis_antarctica.AAC.3